MKNQMFYGISWVDVSIEQFILFLRHPYSAKIQEIRAEHGLTQSMLGKMLGVTAKSVARWEQGRAIVTREQWEKLRRVLSFSCD